MKTIDQLSADELEQVLALKRKIEAILNGSPASVPATAAPAGKGKGKGKRSPMTAETKAKLAKAQKARWAKVRASKSK